MLFNTLRLLRRLERIMERGEQKTIIFTQTKRTADEITRNLRQDGWPALGEYYAMLCGDSRRGSENGSHRSVLLGFRPRQTFLF